MLQKAKKIIGILMIFGMLCNLSILKVYAYDPSSYPYPLTDLRVNDGESPSTVNKGGWVEFNGTNYNYDTDHDVNTLIDNKDPSNPKYDQDGLKEVLQKCYQTFRAWGMCPEGAAAVCGNISCESGGDPTMFGPNWSKSWDDVLVKQGGSFVGLRWFDPYSGGDDIDMGFGLIAFTAQCWCENVWYIAGHQETQWTDLGTQLLVLSYEFGTRSKNNGDDPSEEGKFFHPFYDETADGSELKGNYNWNSYSGYFPSIINDGGAEGKVAILTCAYMANCERPGGSGNISNRVNNAIDYYNEFKDLESCDYSEGGTSSSTKKKVVDDSIGITSEWELEGMPDRSGLVADLVVPTAANRSLLSDREIYDIAQIGEDIKASRYYDLLTYVRVGLVFIGMSLIVYGILLALSLLFDIWNNFFDFSMVSLITFGSVRYARDIELCDDAVKYTSTKKMIVIIVVVTLVGCLIISGGVLPIVLKLIAKLLASNIFVTV